MRAYNVGRCSRCGRIFVEEEFEQRDCFPEHIKNSEKIMLDHITDLGINKKGNHTITAWALDGTLYLLVIPSKEERELLPLDDNRRKFTGEKTDEDLTEPIKKLELPEPDHSFKLEKYGTFSSNG